MPKFIDLTGQRFGKLVVDKYTGKNKYNKCLWLCICDCGNEKIIVGNSLIGNKTKSCGCIKKELIIKRNSKHSNSIRNKISKTYRAWQSMVKRCTNPNATKYKHYGGRGITICDKWLEPNGKGFINFLKDMGECPKNKSLDRIDNDGRYCKYNCCWSTQKEQCRNKRNNHLIPFNGQNLTMIEWSEITKIPYDTIKERLKNGWLIKVALETPVRKHKKYKKRIR